MTVEEVLAILRAAGFRHVVRTQHDEREMIDEGYGLGAAKNFRMWHPLLNQPGKQKTGSAYVGDKPLHVDANGAVRVCFENVLGVKANIPPPKKGPGAGTPRWTDKTLAKLLGAMSRLRP